MTRDQSAERPLPVVERALRNGPGQRHDGWREPVLVVPGGHRPGQPDQLQRDRARARLPVAGPRRIAVLGCTRGAGQTMTVLLAGHMLASLRGESVAVLDLNPGRGSLTERARAIPGLMPDLPETAGPAARPSAPAAPAARQNQGLQVISGGGAADGITAASRILDTVAARYRLTLVDPAAGFVPKTLDGADQLLLVAPASAEAASALAMTFEWLEAHGHDQLAASAVTVLNGVSGTTSAHVDLAANVASGRCRAIVKVPWDRHLRELTQDRAPAGAFYAAPVEVGQDPVGQDPVGQHRTGAERPEPESHGGSGVLSPALTQAYAALAGVLVAGLASPRPGAGELRSVRG